MSEFWSGFAAGVASTIVAAIVIGFIAAMIFFWVMLNADAEGLEPTNDLPELDREDGGPGPIP